MMQADALAEPVPFKLLAALTAEATAAEETVHRAVLLRLFLRDGPRKQISKAADDLADATDELRGLGLARAAVAESVAASWQVSSDDLVSLAELEDAARERPGAAQLAEIGERLRVAAAELEHVLAEAEGDAGQQRAELANAMAALGRLADGPYASVSSPPSAGFDGRL